MRHLHIHGPGRAATSCAAIAARKGIDVTGLSGGSSGDAARAVLGDVPWTAAPPVRVEPNTLVVIGVPDDALETSVRDLAAGRFEAGCAVVHLSGVRGRDVPGPLAGASVDVGAFHPLRSFPSHGSLDGDLGGALVGIEAGPALEADLMGLARAMGGSPFVLPADGRAAYHLGAAAAGNGILAVLDLARSAFHAAGVPDGLAVGGLVTLMSSALSNAAGRGIGAALTGPVARGDVKTLDRHLDAIDQATPEHRALYLALVAGLVRVREGRAGDPGAADVARWLEEVDS